MVESPVQQWDSNLPATADVPGQLSGQSQDLGPEKNSDPIVMNEIFIVFAKQSDCSMSEGPE
jgi:hypothetical protein